MLRFYAYDAHADTRTPSTLPPRSCLSTRAGGGGQGTTSFPSCITLRSGRAFRAVDRRTHLHVAHHLLTTLPLSPRVLFTHHTPRFGRGSAYGRVCVSLSTHLSARMAGWRAVPAFIGGRWRIRPVVASRGLFLPSRRGGVRYWGGGLIFAGGRTWAHGVAHSTLPLALPPNLWLVLPLYVDNVLFQSWVNNYRFLFLHILDYQRFRPLTKHFVA